MARNEALWEIGCVLRNRRTALKMTQTDVAKLLGINTSGICFIENGKRNPTVLQLLKFTNILGLELTVTTKSIATLPHSRAASGREKFGEFARDAKL